MHVSLTEFLLLALVAAAGGAVQGSIGFGQNLVLVPIVALVVPEAVPGVLVALGIPLTVIMATREWHGVDWPGLGWIVLGRVPGTVVGVLIVALVSGDLLSTLAGSAVLVGVLLSVLAGHVTVNRETANRRGRSRRRSRDHRCDRRTAPCPPLPAPSRAHHPRHARLCLHRRRRHVLRRAAHGG